MKIIEPDGSMLDESWENFATLLAAGEEDKIDFFVEEIVFRTVLTWRNRPVVFVARDTRPSGMRLLKALKDGLSIFNTDVVDFGLLTTPQLHYIVAAHNNPSAGDANEDGYFFKLATAFKALMVCSDLCRGCISFC